MMRGDYIRAFHGICDTYLWMGMPMLYDGGYYVNREPLSKDQETILRIMKQVEYKRNSSL